MVGGAYRHSPAGGVWVTHTSAPPFRAAKSAQSAHRRLPGPLDMNDRSGLSLHRGPKQSRSDLAVSSLRGLPLTFMARRCLGGGLTLLSPC